VTVYSSPARFLTVLIVASCNDRSGILHRIFPSINRATPDSAVRRSVLGGFWVQLGIGGHPAQTLAEKFSGLETVADNHSESDHSLTKKAMPLKTAITRARQDKREGKAPSTQAGEFIREEMHHLHEGKRRARSVKQAIAIGLSKARQAGIRLPRSRKGTTLKSTRRRKPALKTTRTRAGHFGTI
jgi:hypothetical protein